MADRASADRACKDPNPIIDGRKANVNLAYLGAKPRVIQPGEKCSLFTPAEVFIHLELDLWLLTLLSISHLTFSSKKHKT